MDYMRSTARTKCSKSSRQQRIPPSKNLFFQVAQNRRKTAPNTSAEVCSSETPVGPRPHVSAVLSPSRDKITHTKITGITVHTVLCQTANCWCLHVVGWTVAMCGHTES